MPNVVEVKFARRMSDPLEEIERARRFESLPRVVESPRAELERMEA